VSRRLRSTGRTKPVIAGLALLATGSLSVVGLAMAPASSAGSLSGTLYKESSTKVSNWLASNGSDPRAALIASKIGSQPAARWFSAYSPSTVQSEVTGYVNAANSAGQIPQLVAYMIPKRDCGDLSAGGAPDISSYTTWVSNFSKGLGSKTVIVILEPDSLALQTCLTSSEVTARDNALSAAVSTIKSANANAKVYLDAGHSSWNSASEAANRLKLAGVSKANGFYTNASNFRYTADEVTFGKAVTAALGNSSLHQVIDVARNGNGPLGSEWCDPAGRVIGAAPTLNTGDSNVDAFLWIKPPGEADGCAAAAGVFSPALAYSLAGGSGTPTSTTTTKSTTTTTKSTTTTTKPTTTTTKPATTTTRTTTTTSAASGSLKCTVTKSVSGSWTGAYQALITVKNTGSVASGNPFKVTFTLPSGQTFASGWGSATLTGSGTAVTATGSAALAAGATVSFNYQANASSATLPSSFSLNGTVCS
jgi:endoglucanase